MAQMTRKFVGGTVQSVIVAQDYELSTMGAPENPETLLELVHTAGVVVTVLGYYYWSGEAWTLIGGTAPQQAQITTTPSGGVAITDPVTNSPIYLGGEIWTRYSTSGQSTVIPTGFGYATALSYYNEDFNEFNSVHGVLLDDIQIDGFLSAFNLAGASYPYTKFRLRGVVSFAANTTGNRSVRLRDSNNQILTTILRPAHSVAANTEKIEFDTGWVPFANYATRPAIISVYPGQDTGGNLNAGADTATPSRIEIGYRL